MGLRMYFKEKAVDDEDREYENQNDKDAGSIPANPALFSPLAA